MTDEKPRHLPDTVYLPDKIGQVLWTMYPRVNCFRYVREIESAWLSIELFQREANEGACWIVYKGRVVQAYHTHDQVFLSRHGSRWCYMTECITAVMPLNAPTAPPVQNSVMVDTDKDTDTKKED